LVVSGSLDLAEINSMIRLVAVQCIMLTEIANLQTHLKQYVVVENKLKVDQL
jgi:hypothetical protein